jgi:hypothetical protein
MERDVLIEAGHRCAIPTCKAVPVELAHIVPWATVKEHTFDNLIALCPTCHTRYDAGQIDRKSMLQYKANLSVMNGRYGEMEQRLLRAFSEGGGEQGLTMQLPGGLDILLINLINDGMLKQVEGGASVLIMGLPQVAYYQLTAKGSEFIKRWLAAQPLD